MFQRGLLLAFSLLQPIFISAYQIDASCVAKGIAPNIRTGMTSAFEMVDAALGRLDATTYAPETVDLIKYLFIAKPGQNPNDKTRMSKVRDVFAGIRNNYRAEVATGSDVSGRDIIIICDPPTYSVVDRVRNLWKDPETQEVLRYNERQCKGLDNIHTLAITTTPSRKDNIALPARMYLCPWFTDFIKSKEYKTADDVMRTRLARSAIKLVEDKNRMFRQIDALALLDKVLLHEMTHGREAYNHDVEGDRQWGLNDVKTPRNWFLPLYRFPAYGWKWACQLAKLGDDVVGRDNPNKNAADNNSDSVALFGSVAKLMDAPTNPQTVNDEGRLVALG